MYHNLFIHSSVDGHLGYFQVLAIINSAAMNNGIHVSFSILVSSEYMPRSGVDWWFCTLAWKIPWMEEPGRLQSMGSLGVGHD